MYESLNAMSAALGAGNRAMLDAYLRSQLIASTLDGPSSQAGGGDDDEEEPVELPDAATLAAFKANVQSFMDADDRIRTLQAATRELNRQRKALTEQILAFMKRFRIEDLNTRNGNLRYRMSFVKAPLTQKEMRNRLLSNFDPGKNADEIAHVVFDVREKTAKVSLRRTPKLLTAG